MREVIYRDLDAFFPFQDDWCALHATLDHLSRLAEHFGIEPPRVPPHYRPPSVGKDFANMGGR